MNTHHNYRTEARLELGASIEGQPDAQLINSVKSLPTAIQAKLGHIADVDEPFESGDVICDKRIPRQRFLAATRNGRVYRVAVEHGGLAHLWWTATVFILDQDGKILYTQSSGYQDEARRQLEASIKGQPDAQWINSVRNLPASILERLGRIADVGEPFGSHAVIYDEEIPRRRFLTATRNGRVYTVAVERGRFAHLRTTTVFILDRDGKILSERRVEDDGGTKSWFAKNLTVGVMTTLVTAAFLIVAFLTNVTLGLVAAVLVGYVCTRVGQRDVS